ncbi:MAG: peptide chain release factor N(5)-glutamine methyltransferase [Bacteroidaceae bacterium]|nr:peptide chain release factor N(5)-glutamine methyltransferase [Bacteroidaceae bacterium]
MNHRELLEQLTPQVGRGEAWAIVRMVMEQRFGLSQTDLLLGKDTQLSADDRTEFQKIAERLLKGEPVQYVLGFADFCGLRFRVTPDVLIPRPETEELVQWVVRSCGNQEPESIVDLCTGSGCIATSLALAFPKAVVEGVDISEAALAVARDNARQLQAGNVRFFRKDVLDVNAWNPSAEEAVVSETSFVSEEAVVHGKSVVSDEAVVSGKSVVLDEVVVSGKTDLSDEVVVSGKTDLSDEAVVSGETDLSDEVVVSGKSDVLDEAVTSNCEEDEKDGDKPLSSFSVFVSNPPYVRCSEATEMTATVLDYEPHLALFVPDSDPLCFYRSIATIARRNLLPGGFLFLEINTAFAEELRRLLCDAGFSDVQVRRDQYERPRMIRATKRD